MNFTSRCDQGISGLVERHQGGNCRASILEFLESRRGGGARINVSVQVNARAQSPPPPPPPLPSRSPDSTHQPSGFTVNVVVYTGWRDRYPAKAAERLSDELACVSTAETSPSLLPPPLFPPSLTAPMLFLANLRLRRFPSSDRKERSSISNAIKI